MIAQSLPTAFHVSHSWHHSQKKWVVVLSVATARALAVTAPQATLNDSTTSFDWPRLRLEHLAFPPTHAAATEATRSHNNHPDDDMCAPFLVLQLKIVLPTMFWWKGTFTDV